MSYLSKAYTYTYMIIFHCAQLQCSIINCMQDWKGRQAYSVFDFFYSYKFAVVDNNVFRLYSKPSSSSSSICSARSLLIPVVPMHMIAWKNSSLKWFIMRQGQVNFTHPLTTTITTSTRCGRKKWTPKFFRRFLSNRLGF